MIWSASPHRYLEWFKRDNMFDVSQPTERINDLCRMTGGLLGCTSISPSAFRTMLFDATSHQCYCHSGWQDPPSESRRRAHAAGSFGTQCWLFTGSILVPCCDFHRSSGHPVLGWLRAHVRSFSHLVVALILSSLFACARGGFVEFARKRDQEHRVDNDIHPSCTGSCLT